LQQTPKKKITKGRGEKVKSQVTDFLHLINKNISGAIPMRDTLQFTEERKVLISAKCPEPAKISVDSTVLKKKNKKKHLVSPH
jgi:hypothetical protein